MIIREIQFVKDIAALLALEKAAFAQDAFPAIEFLFLYVQGKDTFLVAYQDKQLIGYISAYSEDHTAYIASIAVDPQYRRQGLGRTLIQKIIEIFQGKQSVVLLELHVRQSNHAAIALYHSLGFTVSYTELDYYQGEDALVMTLALRHGD